MTTIVPNQTQFKLKSPGSFGINEDWLEQFCELRAKVLYNEGSRPYFKQPDGSFDDQDEFETSCYHLLAYRNAQLVGGIRLLPLESPYRCISSKIVGEEHFVKIIVEHYLKHNLRPAEVNRWVVEKKFQNTRIGLELAAGVIELSNILGFTLIGNGNSEKKANFHITHSGCVIISGNKDTYQSKIYNDDDIVLFKFANKMSPFLSKLAKNLDNIIKPS